MGTHRSRLCSGARICLAVFATTVPGFAQPAAGELLDALLSAEDGAAAQVELRRRGETVAAAVGERFRHGFDGHEREDRALAGAARVLMDLGSRGVPALEALIDCLYDGAASPAKVQLAAQAIERIAPFAGERGRALQKELFDVYRARHGRSLRREFDAWWPKVASSLDVDAAGATLDSLLARLADDNVHAAATACRALVARRDEFAGSASRVARALVERVEAELEPNESRSWIVDGHHFGTRVNADMARWLRTEAALALLRYRPDHAATVLGWCQELFDLDPERRLEAVRALSVLRPAEAGPWLVEAARYDPSGVGVSALEGLARIGPSMRYVARRLHDLERELRDAQPEAASAARRALLVLAPDLPEPPVVPSFEVAGGGIPGDSKIDLDEERRRLLSWLDRDEGSNRVRLLDDPSHVDRFHELASDEGGPASPAIRWLPVRTAPDPFRPGRWAALAGESFDDVVLASPPGSVGDDGERASSAPWVIELIPTDRDEPRLSGAHCDVRYDYGSSFQAHAHGSHAGVMSDLKRELSKREGPLLTVVDGLVVWLRKVGPDEPFEWPVCGFAVRPGAEDRMPALHTLPQR